MFLCHHNSVLLVILGDADEIRLPKNNVWYFNGYDLDSAFDQYFSNPTVSFSQICHTTVMPC